MLKLKKGSKVIMCGFTGIKLGVFEISAVTEKSATIVKSNGDKLVFSLKSGKQTNTVEGKERYANSIMEDDGSYVAPQRTKKVEEKPAKTAAKAKTKAAAEDDEDEDEDEKPAKSAKASKATAKTPAKSTSKAKAKQIEEDEDEDEDEYEEVDE